MKSADPIPGIYLIASKLNGVHYVGGSLDYYQRWKNHRSEIRRAKHGYAVHFLPAFKANKLSFFLLEQCPMGCAQWYLDAREQYWMDQFPDRINKSKFVTTLGVSPSPEVRKRLSNANKGKTASAKTRAKMRKAHKGRVHFRGYKLSEETCRKMSESAKKRMWSDEIRKKIGKSNIGKHTISPEQQEKMKRARAANRKRKQLVP